MTKILIPLCLFCAISGYCQSVALYQGGEKLVGLSNESVDSIVFYTDNQGITPHYTDTPRPIPVKGHWCAVGTSITWYNDNVDYAEGKFTEGYPDRVRKRLAFSNFTNVAVSGGTISTAISKIVYADYYTIEHGINDWGKGVAPGTFQDYINNSDNGTFAAEYRKLIDRIFAVNPDARIVLCTPRKGNGFNGYLPEKWYEPKNGVYLKEYVDLVRAIAEFEGLPVADFFAECGGQHNLHRLSIDTSLHPNDQGYQLMANVLVQAFMKVISY